MRRLQPPTHTHTASCHACGSCSQQGFLDPGGGNGPGRQQDVICAKARAFDLSEGQRDSLRLWAQGYKERGETAVGAHAAGHGAPGQAPAGPGAQAVPAGGQHSCPGREWPLTVLSAATEAGTGLCSPPPGARGSVSWPLQGNRAPRASLNVPLPSPHRQEPHYPIVFPCTSQPPRPSPPGLRPPPSPGCVCVCQPGLCLPLETQLPVPLTPTVLLC